MCPLGVTAPARAVPHRARQDASEVASASGSTAAAAGHVGRQGKLSGGCGQQHIHNHSNNTGVWLRVSLAVAGPFGTGKAVQGKREAQ